MPQNVGGYRISMAVTVVVLVLEHLLPARA
jgi:hypothetical protein